MAGTVFIMERTLHVVLEGLGHPCYPPRTPSVFSVRIGHGRCTTGSLIAISSELCRAGSAFQKFLPVGGMSSRKDGIERNADVCCCIIKNPSIYGSLEGCAISTDHVFVVAATSLPLLLRSQYISLHQSPGW